MSKQQHTPEIEIGSTWIGVSDNEVVQVTGCGTQQVKWSRHEDGKKSQSAIWWFKQWYTKYESK